MASDATLGVRIKVKGAGEAAKEVGQVFDKAKEGERGVRAEVQKTAEATRGLTGSTVTAAAAVGTFLSGVAMRSISALGSGIAQSLDPHMTAFEKAFHMQSAIIGADPTGGAVGQAAFSAENAVQLQAQRATSAQLAGTFGDVGAALALSRKPDGSFRSDEEIRQELQNLTQSPQYRDLAQVFSRQATGREIAEQVVAESVDPGAGPQGFGFGKGLGPVFRTIADGIIDVGAKLGKMIDEDAASSKEIKERLFGIEQNTRGLRGGR